MRATERDAKIVALFEADLELLRRKGRDYSGDEDCLRNFRDFGSYGILVRLSDKFTRLKNLVISGQPALVQDESIKDTLRDIRNYAFLYEVMLGQEKRSEDETEEEAKVLSKMR